MNAAGAIRVGILARMMAVRAGLRAMLGAPASPGFAPASVVQVICEGADPETIQAAATALDVIIVFADTESAVSLLRNGLGSNQLPGRPAVLLLTDDVLAAQAIAAQAIAAQAIAAQATASQTNVSIADALAPPSPAPGGRVWGVLPVDSQGEELLAAVQALHNRMIVAAPELIASLVQGVGFRAMFRTAPEEINIRALTERESQVLQLLAKGLANKQIAGVLGISEHTVKFHISSIYSKLGVTSRTEAARTGVLHGLIIL